MCLATQSTAFSLPSVISHLAGAIFHVDLGHVGHVTQALHAVSLPAAHRLRQDLELQVLALPQLLALRLDTNARIKDAIDLKNILYRTTLERIGNNFKLLSNM